MSVIHDKTIRDAPEMSRYDLGDHLTVAAKKLQGVRSDHWVDQPSLCGTCKHATIIRRASKNHRMIQCAELNAYVPEDISECSSYANITTLSLTQMADIAVIIDNRTEKVKGYL